MTQEQKDKIIDWFIEHRKYNEAPEDAKKEAEQFIEDNFND